MHVARLCPMGMIFVRSRDGISHNPKEWSSPEDCEAGCKVLYSAVLDVAGRG
jgi:allantoate deiminase